MWMLVHFLLKKHIGGLPSWQGVPVHAGPKTEPGVWKDCWGWPVSSGIGWRLVTRGWVCRLCLQGVTGAVRVPRMGEPPVSRWSGWRTARFVCLSGTANQALKLIKTGRASESDKED